MLQAANDTKAVNVLFAALLALTTSGVVQAQDKRIEAARWDPPTRYAMPYKGRLHLRRLPPAGLAKINVLTECEKLGIPSVTGKPRGCAWHSADFSECWVITIDRPYYGTTPEAVLTHELGHCNGWEGHHPV